MGPESAALDSRGPRGLARAVVELTFAPRHGRVGTDCQRQLWRGCGKYYAYVGVRNVRALVYILKAKKTQSGRM